MNTTPVLCIIQTHFINSKHTFSYVKPLALKVIVCLPHSSPIQGSIVLLTSKQPPLMRLIWSSMTRSENPGIFFANLMTSLTTSLNRDLNCCQHPLGPSCKQWTFQMFGSKEDSRSSYISIMSDFLQYVWKVWNGFSPQLIITTLLNQSFIIKTSDEMRCSIVFMRIVLPHLFCFVFFTI